MFFVVICFRRMNRTHVFLTVGAVAIILAVGVWQFYPRTEVSAPVSGQLQPSAPEVASTTPSETTQVSISRPVAKSSYLLPLAQGDVVVSWDIDGPFNDNGPLEEAARKKIMKLNGQLNGSKDDYQTYISLAQTHEYLGEGKMAYEYLSLAIALDTDNTTGIGWHNIALLMEKLGAYRTARIAHDRAVSIQPGISSFHISRVELMIYHFPDDRDGVEEAFKDAEITLGADDQMLLDLRQRWQARS